VDLAASSPVEAPVFSMAWLMRRWRQWWTISQEADGIEFRLQLGNHLGEQDTSGQTGRAHSELNQRQFTTIQEMKYEQTAVSTIT
jgi:hypothetical protein